MNEFDNYREEVSEAIRRRTGAAVFNGSYHHASVITQEAFKNAQNTVRILTHKLDPDCYAREQVKNAVTFFLANPSHRLQILIETETWDEEEKYNWNEHPLIKGLLSFARKSDNSDEDQITLKRVPKSWSIANSCNFLLLDNFGYRYEADRRFPAAVAAFFPAGQEAPVAGLDQCFNSLWGSAKKISLA